MSFSTIQSDDCTHNPVNEFNRDISPDNHIFGVDSFSFVRLVTENDDSVVIHNEQTGSLRPPQLSSW